LLTYSRQDRIETLFSVLINSPLQRVDVEWTAFSSVDETLKQGSTSHQHKVEVWCKRDDLLHSLISGNKWRKLAKPLHDFALSAPSHILSFGGPYSNHLHALAYCCKQLNIKFTAVIRGAYLKDQALNQTLRDLKNWNAHLVFVDKQCYEKRTDQDYLAKLRIEHNADIIIPEGGSQPDALFGMQTMIDEITAANSSKPFDAILLPVGSGASMAGLIESCRAETALQIIGIGVLKGKGYLEDLVKQFLNNSHKSTNKDTPYLPWHINHHFHFGGYAKTTPELKAFCKDFNRQQAALTKRDTKQDTPVNLKQTPKQDTPICIEPVYSGKCFFALKTLIQQGYFAPNSKILLIHTGGLQGARQQVDTA
jgi:1-aminocyclopropane-1-carboxylate deaminase